MSIIEAIIMGIVQGLTEFLPVSSSGHLAISKYILGIDLEAGVLFEMLLHIGTLIAIFIVYYKDIISLFLEGLGIVKDSIIFMFNLLNPQKKDNIKIIDSEYRKFVMLIIIASIPTAIIGLLLKDFVVYGFSSLLVPSVALLITGTFLFASSKIAKGNKLPNDTKYKDSIFVGIIQGIATIPGISRSGSTIVAGQLMGMEKEFVVKFSFLMSIPAVLGGTLLEIKDVTGDMLNQSLIAPYLIGTIASAIVGYICIKTLLKVIKKDKLHYFSYYCWTIGFLSLGWYFLN